MIETEVQIGKSYSRNLTQTLSDSLRTYVVVMGEAPGLGTAPAAGGGGVAADAAGLAGLSEAGKFGLRLMREAAAVGEGQYGGGGTAC